MGFVSKYRNKYQTGGLQHLRATHIRQEAGPEIFESYFKFAFIRNPWDKAVSQYAYMRTRPDLREYIGMREDDSFKRYLQLIDRRKHVQWEEQHRFLFDEDGRLLVDFIGRFERYHADTQKLFARLGIESVTPRTNVSERAPLETYFDEESVDAIARMYRRDLELFDYSAAAPALF